MLVLFVLPPLLVRPAQSVSAIDRLRLENEERATLIQLFGGAALIAGLLFTYYTVGVNTKSVEVSRETQVTQRFTQAVAQLGDRSITVRLGGIYALERIARDSPRDHGPIVEVLSAFLRDQSLRGNVLMAVPSKGAGPVPGHWLPTEHLRADLQAAVTVLGRRDVTLDYPGDWRLDLHQVDLRRGDLRRLILHRALLWGANLEHTNLSDALLDGADFAGAHMEGAILGDATLRGCHFSDTNLANALLYGADLRGAHLLGTNLQGAVLSGSKLKGASFAGAQTLGTYMTAVDLAEALNLTQAQMEVALTDQTTIWPPDLKPPAHP